VLLIETSTIIELKKTKSLRQIIHNDVDYYQHSHQVFEALNKIRSSPSKYIDQLEDLKQNAAIDNTGAYIKINDYILRSTKYDIESLKEYLIRISKNEGTGYKSETIMWSEKLQQVGIDIINNLDDVDYFQVKKDLNKRISHALAYDCDNIDFILYHNLDPVMSVFVLLLENPKLKDKLLCDNYHFGAVSCGSFKEVASVTIVFLINKLYKTVTEEEYLELDLNDRMFEGVLYKDSIRDGVIVESDGAKHVVSFTLVDGSLKEEVFHFNRKKK